MSCEVCWRTIGRDEFKFSELKIEKSKGFPRAVKPDIEWEATDDIVQVEASGEELLFIFRTFNDIPSRAFNNKPQIWTGDFAKFIVLNWE